MMPATALSRRSIAAATIYAAFAVLCLVAAVVALAELRDRYAGLRAAERMLTELRQRSPSSQAAEQVLSGAPSGSPFLQGGTVSLAGAALLQRLAQAVGKTGGVIVSSQVNLKLKAADSRWISVSMSIDLDEKQLQPFLYDLEAGMPFLFIENLVVQAPAPSVNQPRMHLAFEVTGQWEGKTR